jgi:hypothetical protein
MKKSHRYLVVCYDIGDIGAWFFNDRKSAINKKRELTEFADPEDVDVFYGKIRESNIRVGKRGV